MKNLHFKDNLYFQKTGGSWVSVSEHFKNKRLRLFCFPHAGGGAAMYRQWGDGMPDGIEVFSVHLPGREDRIRERPHVRIAPLVDDLIEALIPCFDGAPYAFFGHSMGAVIAYEVAQRLLTRHGESPAHLFVSARQAPHLPLIRTPWYMLSDDDLKEKLRQLNGTPDDVLKNDDVMGILLPMLRADFELNETYQSSTHALLECPITAFGALGDVHVEAEQLDAWRYLTNRSFDIRFFPGNHFYIKEQKSAVIAILAQRLTSYLPTVHPSSC